MNTPIIDPSTLTEEQRKIIKHHYLGSTRELTKREDKAYNNGWNDILFFLFGENFFKEGE